jgi:hypothetical protein
MSGRLMQLRFIFTEFAESHRGVTWFKEDRLRNKMFPIEDVLMIKRGICRYKGATSACHMMEAPNTVVSCPMFTMGFIIPNNRCQITHVKGSMSHRDPSSPKESSRNPAQMLYGYDRTI